MVQLVGAKSGEQTQGDARIERKRITITGTVQGVGFRPFVYGLANRHGLSGMVLNSTQGVLIEVEGPPLAVSRFCDQLRSNPPSLARITAYHEQDLPPVGGKDFVIMASTEGVGRDALIPPDVGLCVKCAEETLDPTDRRYQYPFTNCTNCGPRFSIVHSLPYDRPQTSMQAFAMCPACAEEYHRPTDRRFHAQPVACPFCGPHVELVNRRGEVIAKSVNPVVASALAGLGGAPFWLQKIWETLGQGKIIAVKSIGGFHLTCDPFSVPAVSELRRRKGRNAKPFALMAKDLFTLEKYCRLTAEEKRQLSSPSAPIVVVRQREESGLPEVVNPGLKSLGVMLPYTPLHLLLFSGPFDLLVMTSGNYSELPLAKDNKTAFHELRDVADVFLWHNREIVNRCDDSILMVVNEEARMIRRSRGFVPEPIVVTLDFPEAFRLHFQDFQGWGRTFPVVLGTGSEMKNTFCIFRISPQESQESASVTGEAFISQHIGELDTEEGIENFKASLENYQNLLGVTPDVIAYDMHPDYNVSQVAKTLPAQLHVAVQHHHAHLAAALAEHELLAHPVIGLVLDGTGYGTDGKLWGFEIFHGTVDDFQRWGHLAYTPLPGGDAAVRNPWRTAVAFLGAHLQEQGWEAANRLFGRHREGIALIRSMLERRFNSPESSGAGRLFDSVSAMIGLCREASYDGQAAIELSEMAPDWREGSKMGVYPFEWLLGKNGHYLLEPKGLLKEILNDLSNNADKSVIAARFHNSIAQSLVEAANRVAETINTPGKHNRRVVLSGGVWQNRYLSALVEERLNKLGFEVFPQKRVPANDGGLALGQAVIAYRRWLTHVSGCTR